MMALFLQTGARRSMISKWRNWFGGRRGGVFFLLLGIGIIGIFIVTISPVI